MITAPTFAKRFKYREQSVIWQDVAFSCSRAREVVFLGYSAPLDDCLTVAVLRKAFRAGARPPRVLIIDAAKILDERSGKRGARPTTFYQDLKDRFSKAFGPSLENDRHYLSWTFGQDEPLAEHIEKRLARATIR